jgi:hypothetical protein
MTALEKLNALQAEIEAFAVDTRAGVYSNHPSDWKARHDKIQDTKVEVTKVVLPVVEDAMETLLQVYNAHFRNDDERAQAMIMAWKKHGNALTLLQQLKESL